MPSGLAKVNLSYNNLENHGSSFAEKVKKNNRIK
jgi:hypothetical protein